MDWQSMAKVFLIHYKKLGRKQPSFRKAQVDPHFSLFYLIPTIDPEHIFV